MKLDSRKGTILAGAGVLAKLGLWSIVGGSLAAFMTGCMAGLLG